MRGLERGVFFAERIDAGGNFGADRSTLVGSCLHLLGHGRAVDDLARHVGYESRRYDRSKSRDRCADGSFGYGLDRDGDATSQCRQRQPCESGNAHESGRVTEELGGGNVGAVAF
jgi:hypothetical protein